MMLDLIVALDWSVCPVTCRYVVCPNIPHSESCDFQTCQDAKYRVCCQIRPFSLLCYCNRVEQTIEQTIDLYCPVVACKDKHFVKLYHSR